MFTRINSQSKGAVIAEEIARACKPFTEGEVIKNCIEKVCNVVCPNKRQAFTDISLSRNTVASRLDELASDLRPDSTGRVTATLRLRHVLAAVTAADRFHSNQ